VEEKRRIRPPHEIARPSPVGKRKKELGLLTVSILVGWKNETFFRPSTQRKKGAVELKSFR